jgi:hypothetical protein
VAESQAVDGAAGATGATEPTEAEGYVGGADAAESLDADETLYCYRHPSRETRLRCRTCDRPICPKCAIQTPVGFRCPEDGRVKNDPFTRFSPVQLVAALGVALIGGTIAGVIANQIGFFSIIISYFAGSFIVQAEDRIVGLKRGPIITGIVIGGIFLGGLIGFAYEYWSFLSLIAADAQDVSLRGLFQQQITYALISAGAAAVGAWQRLR